MEGYLNQKKMGAGGVNVYRLNAKKMLQYQS